MGTAVKRAKAGGITAVQGEAKKRSVGEKGGGRKKTPGEAKSGKATGNARKSRRGSTTRHRREQKPEYEIGAIEEKPTSEAIQSKNSWTVGRGSEMSRRGGARPVPRATERR